MVEGEQHSEVKSCLNQQESSSTRLIKASIYPRKHFLPANAQEPWTEFQVAVADRSESEGRVRDWFNIYERDDLARVYVTEEFIPVQSMGTPLVLLTVDEAHLFPEEEDDYDAD